MHNKVKSKLEEAEKLSNKLKSSLQLEELGDQTDHNYLPGLELLAVAYNNTVLELIELYKQDKTNELEEGKLAAQ